MASYFSGSDHMAIYCSLRRYLSASLLPTEFVCHLFLDIILSSLLLLCHQESNRELTKIQTQRPARTQSLEPSPGESKGPTVCFPCFLRSRGQGPGQIRD